MHKHAILNLSEISYLKAWIFDRWVSTSQNMGFPWVPSRSLQEAVDELLVHTSFYKDMHGCLLRNAQSIASFLSTLILQGWCQMSDVVSNFKHGIISKHFELEGWNFVWCFLMTWQARFSSRIKIGHPQPPYHPPKQGQKANFYNFGLMSMKFLKEYN